MINKKKTLTEDQLMVGKLSWLMRQHIKYEQIKINQSKIWDLWMSGIFITFVLALMVTPVLFIVTLLLGVPLILCELLLEEKKQKVWKRIRKHTRG